MFKSMNADKVGDRGKLAGERSKLGKATQWSLGDEPHEPAQTVTARDFGSFSGQNLERTKKIP